MKTLIKLALVALVANATWHVWGVYAAHFKFKDAVQSLAQYGSGQSESELRQRILELAAQYDVPITDSSFTITRQEKHTIVDGAYSRPIDLAPGFSSPWTFNWHIDVVTTAPPKLKDYVP
jgi:hypothetical protein